MACDFDAPATDASRSRWAVVLPLLAVVGVAALLVVVTREPASGPAMSGPAGSGSATAEGPPAVEVASDAPRFASLEELAAASDAAVRAEVVATERGRWFGDGAGGTRIQSRLVTLRVTEVMAGVAPSSATLLLEEEGWLEDGAPLVVDGAAPSQVGDDGIWFVLDGTDPGSVPTSSSTPRAATSSPAMAAPFRAPPEMIHSWLGSRPSPLTSSPPTCARSDTQRAAVTTFPAAPETTRGHPGPRRHHGGRRVARGGAALTVAGRRPRPAGARAPPSRG